MRYVPFRFSFGFHFQFHFVEIDIGLIGLALTYSISLAGMFQYGVRMSTEVENLVSFHARGDG